MKILGWDVDNTKVVIAACGAVGAVGACYALLKYLTSSSHIRRLGRRKRQDGEADAELPLILEQEYGNLKGLCKTADPKGSEYLNDIPEHYFHFKENFFNFIADVTSQNSETYRRALVFGSGTGYIVFNLATIFQEVKGIEKSFSQVVTCYRFQNLNNIIYNFPAEGTLNTISRAVKSPLLLNKPVKKTGRRKPKENIEFINAEIDSKPPNHFGEYQAVIVNNSLEDLKDPVEFLALLKGCVVLQGILIISSTYNWKNRLNQPSGFAIPEVSSSFELLKNVLQKHFKFIQDKNIPEIICESTRSCRIQHNHVTVWRREDSDNLTNIIKNGDEKD